MNLSTREMLLGREIYSDCNERITRNQALIIATPSKEYFCSKAADRNPIVTEIFSLTDEQIDEAKRLYEAITQFGAF